MVVNISLVLLQGQSPGGSIICEPLHDRLLWIITSIVWREAYGMFE